MSAKCDRCGVETSLDASFFKEHKSFSRLILTLCPCCWGKHQHSTAKWIFLSNFGFGAVGLLFWFVWPELGVGRVFVNLFIFEIFLALTILPHEMGHAGMAHWLGMRVFKAYIGSGKTLFSSEWFGFDIEFKAVPMGGLAIATHRTLHWLRTKHFAFVLAGPAVNCLLAAAIWPFIDPEKLWSFRPLEHGLQFGLLFFYANLSVLIENLWPHNVKTPLGVFPSDGKQLFQCLFLSRETKELYHAANFVTEASVCHQRGHYAEARNWVEKGLALYPDNEALLNWLGVILLELCEYEPARECFQKLLHCDSKQPLFRPLMLNNIAYANALIGAPALLEEADRFSQEALAGLGWLPAIKGTRGTVLVALGRFDEGILLLQESMAQAEIPSHKAQNACFIAEAESRRGNLVAARTYLDEARKLDPKCTLLKRAEAAQNVSPVS